MDQPLRSECPFCTPDPERIILVNEHAVALYDGFPVTPGHSLIVPRRHMTSFFDATPVERAALFDLLDEVRALLLATPQPSVHDASGTALPDGFNVGINDGAAAGQTVPHAHIHLIPRYTADTDDPRGGVRWIMPEKAPYWKKR